jgi:hypothetical protein
MSTLGWALLRLALGAPGAREVEVEAKNGLALRRTYFPALEKSGAHDPGLEGEIVRWCRARLSSR